MDELVFAVPSAEIWNILTYKEKGLIYGGSEALKIIVQKGLYRRRHELEDDPAFKQIIPYAVISCKESLYLFMRKPGQNEKRLQNLYSLGVGGHMNPGNAGVPEEKYLLDELKREFFEEVRLLNSCSIEDIQFIGFLNDDTIPVGRFHIGLLYNIRLSDKDIKVNETDKMTATWTDKPGLIEFYQGMETWSKIIHDYFIMA